MQQRQQHRGRQRQVPSQAKARAACVAGQPRLARHGQHVQLGGCSFLPASGAWVCVGSPKTITRKLTAE